VYDAKEDARFPGAARETVELQRRDFEAQTAMMGRHDQLGAGY